MSYLNLMGNKLKTKEVNDALTELNALSPETPTTVNASDVSYNNATSHLLATNAQTAIDEVNARVNANTLNVAGGVTVDTTEYIPITMTNDGYITIYTLTDQGNANIDIARNTTGSVYERLSTTDGAYRFCTLYVKKGMSLYIKASAENIGGYFITTLS